MRTGLEHLTDRELLCMRKTLTWSINLIYAIPFAVVALIAAAVLFG